MVRWKKEPDALVVYFSGEIDHCTASRFRERVDEQIQKGDTRVLILDFSDVTFMDSSGIGMLIGRYKMMMALGGRIYARNLNAPVERLYRMAGLYRIIPVEQVKGRKED